MTYNEFLGTTEQPVFEEPAALSFEFIEPDYKQPEELDFFNENAHDRKLNSIPEPSYDTEAEALFDTIGIPAYKKSNENTRKKAEDKKMKKPAGKEAVEPKPVIVEENKETESKIQEQTKKDAEPKSADKTKNVSTALPEKETIVNDIIPDLEDEEINDSEVGEGTYILNEDPAADDNIINETIVDVPDEDIVIIDKEEFVTPEDNTSGISHVFVEQREIIDDNDETGEKKKGNFTFVKTAVAAAAMFVFIIGIPFLMNFTKKFDRQENVAKDIIVTTEEKKTVFDESTSLAFISASNNISITEEGNSSRFDNIDDLTFYLSANLASTLSAEQQLVKQYTSGQIDYYYFVEQMNANIKIADELQHLLIANKNSYKNAGLEEKYNELSDYSDTLIVFGDKAVYEAGNGQIFTTEK